MGALDGDCGEVLLRLLRFLPRGLCFCSLRRGLFLRKTLLKDEGLLRVIAQRVDLFPLLLDRLGRHALPYPCLDPRRGLVGRQFDRLRQ